MTSEDPGTTFEELTGRFGFADGPWAERVVGRRELLNDGVRTSVARLVLGAVVFGALGMGTSASRWFLVLALLPLAQGSLEIGSERDLREYDDDAHRSSRITRWITGTARRSWETGLTLNATGVLGAITCATMAIVVLGIALPIDASTWAVVTVWAGVILYSMSGCRSVMMGAQLFHVSDGPWSWLRTAARHVIGAVLSVTALGVLAVVQVTRGSYPAAASPALVVVCLVPLLMRAEISMVERVLAASSSENETDLSRQRRESSATAYDVARRAAATVLYAQHSQEQFARTQAMDAMENLGPLVEAVVSSPAVQGVVAPETVRRAVNRVLGERLAGVADVEVVGAGPVQVAELDSMLRVVRAVERLREGLPPLPDSSADTLEDGGTATAPPSRRVTVRSTVTSLSVTFVETGTGGEVASAAASVAEVLDPYRTVVQAVEVEEPGGIRVTLVRGRSGRKEES